MAAALVCAFTASFCPSLGAYRPFGRTVAASMSHQLNNYKLDGPLMPLGNQILVKFSPVDDKTDGGLILTSMATEKPKEGTVVAAGPGRMNPQTCALDANPFAVGDLLLLSEYSGEKVEYDGEKHVLLDADAVLGKFDGAEPLADLFQPALDKVLVKLAKAATETSSGIAIAGAEEEESNQGEVVAVGVKAPTLAVGDRVLYDKLAGCDAVLEGRTYKLVPAAECFAKW